jgi:hypothetical protein
MKTSITRPIQHIAALAVMTLCSLPVIAATPHISATLQPATVSVGQHAQLTVTVTGGSGEEPAVPHVDGLDITPFGQSSEFQSINGVTTASNSQTYLVTPNHAGRFTIPPLKIGNGGEATQPIVLQATGSSTAPTAGGQPSSALPTPTIPGADDDHSLSNNDQQTFLRLVMPQRALHVGELVPVQIKAYFRNGLQASVNGLPSLSSDAFTLNSLDDKPEQTQENINGQSYAVLTWTTALCAVKAGDYSLSLDMPVLLTIPAHANKPRDQSDDPFNNDPFFDNFFGNTVEKQVTLSSHADVETVLPLPATHQPSSFSGAVGQFTVTAEASPNHVAAGDPITLRLTVTGSGNFDRVASSLLSNSTDWKSYKPVARFTPTDSVGFEGTKTFEQAVVPLQSGQLKIPPLSFSYFDPKTDKYVTRTTTPIAIDVSSVANQPASVTAAETNNNADQPTFMPNRVEAGQFVSTLQPLFLQPRFLLANLVAWGGLALLSFFVSRHVRRAHDPHFAKARQADRTIHDQLTAMDAAIQKMETATFFAAARCALQQRLGERWGLPPETITMTEINARLNGNGEGIRPVFQMADKVAYSHENLPGGDLVGWKKIVIEELKHLETL